MCTQKRFDYIFSLGLNCEIANQIRLNHGFVESSLFAWAATPVSKIVEIINNPNLIFSGEITHSLMNNMFYCNITECWFHGRKKGHELKDIDDKLLNNIIEEEKYECICRVNHLKNKFLEYSHSEYSKLYVIGIHPDFCDIENKQLNKFICELSNALLNSHKNSYILIIVDEEQCNILHNGTQDSRRFKIHCDNNGRSYDPDRVYIRAINNFAPKHKSATKEFLDMQGYKAIFSEFIPKVFKHSTKIYKFQR